MKGINIVRVFQSLLEGKEIHTLKIRMPQKIARDYNIEIQIMRKLF